MVALGTAHRTYPGRTRPTKRTSAGAGQRTDDPPNPALALNLAHMQRKCLRRTSVSGGRWLKKRAAGKEWCASPALWGRLSHRRCRDATHLC